MKNPNLLPARDVLIGRRYNDFFFFYTLPVHLVGVLYYYTDPRAADDVSLVICLQHNCY